MQNWSVERTLSPPPPQTYILESAPRACSSRRTGVGAGHGASGDEDATNRGERSSAGCSQVRAASSTTISAFFAERAADTRIERLLRRARGRHKNRGDYSGELYQYMSQYCVMLLKRASSRSNFKNCVTKDVNAFDRNLLQ